MEKSTDVESLDELEKNFQTVISELINDRTLDSFRDDYEKLY